jgi:hypothetical protein
MSRLMIYLFFSGFFGSEIKPPDRRRDQEADICTQAPDAGRGPVYRNGMASMLTILYWEQVPWVTIQIADPLRRRRQIFKPEQLNIALGSKITARLYLQSLPRGIHNGECGKLTNFCKAAIFADEDSITGSPGSYAPNAPFVTLSCLGRPECAQLSRP